MDEIMVKMSDKNLERLAMFTEDDIPPIRKISKLYQYGEKIQLTQSSERFSLGERITIAKSIRHIARILLTVKKSPEKHLT